MAVYVVDSSALVKRYVREIGTAWICGLMDPTEGHILYIAGITGVEVVSALTRQTRGGALTPTDAAQALAQFRQDFARQYQIVDLTPPLIAQAMALAETHALRGYDAVQCAVAVELHHGAPSARDARANPAVCGYGAQRCDGGRRDTG